MGPRLLPGAGIAGIARRLRRGAVTRADAEYHARFPTGPEGVVAGAEGFTLHGSTGRGLLLLHGSGDTPQTLRFLAGRLHAAGYTVHVPLLPGHGRAPSAFLAVHAADYRAAADAALDLLRREASWIGVVGLSMGGALAVPLAAGAGDVRALVLLAPYLEPPPLVRWIARLGPVWGPLVPFLDGRGEGSVHDTASGLASRAYGVFSANAMRALVETAATGQRALAAVTVPTLIIHSREDIRIPTAIAERASATLRAPAERHWVTGCGHVITVDYCKQVVADLVLDFLTRLPAR
jgi:carboxylesterase